MHFQTTAGARFLLPPLTAQEQGLCGILSAPGDPCGAPLYPYPLAPASALSSFPGADGCRFAFCDLLLMNGRLDGALTPAKCFCEHIKDMGPMQGCCALARGR